MGYGIKRTGRSAVAYKQNLINHIAIVVDGSSSMDIHAQSVVKVVDAQTAYLARRSKEMDQETRVSVYVFADDVECLIYDTDVLRLPSIKNLYAPYGNTALLSATIKSQQDLAATSTLYGEHSFLTFVITDGQENCSYDARHQRLRPAALNALINGLEDNWTVAALVPDVIGKREAISFGFPKDNVAIWDTSSAAGLEEAGEVINAATESFLQGRASGQRGSRTIFSTGSDAVNKATVSAALTPLAGDKYRLIPVVPDGAAKGTKVRVDKFIKDDCGMSFKLGTVYYQWNKRESVQPQKRLAVVEKKTDRVFVGTGDEIRDMIGLPSMLFKDKPVANPDYDVFVQSTAPNRNLLAFTKVLVML
jgi:hypothetical protein